MSAYTFSYAGEGLLNLNLVCPAAATPTYPTNATKPTKPYGFDGTSLQLVDVSDESDGHGHSFLCETIDNFERP